MAQLRVIQSMRDRYVYHYLSFDNRKKIVAISTDFSKPSLGLEADLYNEMASGVTGIIHCAWSVNFNLGLGSFEADCIVGQPVPQSLVKQHHL
jgi:thioester reductase-like protein